MVDRHTTVKSRLAILVKPAFLVALMLLVLNDHVFKQAYPSWLTGKLSDFSGLLVFAVFMYVLIPSRYRTRKFIMWLHVAIGSGFVIWKVAPVEIMLQHIGRISGLPMPGRVKDVTDLIALSVLPISYTFISSFEFGPGRAVTSRAVHKALAVLILLATAWSIVATSQPLGPDELVCCTGTRGNVDGDTLDVVDANDVEYLADYLYNNGPRPPCLIEADVDGSGDKNPVTEADLQYLVDFLYDNGPPPGDCRND